MTGGRSCKTNRPGACTYLRLRIHQYCRLLIVERYDLSLDSPELLQIMPKRATNINEQCRVRRVFHALDQPILNRVEIRVHPARSTLSVASHVVVELVSEWRVCLQILKHVHLCVEGVLVWSRLDVGGGRVIGHGHVLGKFAARGVATARTALISTVSASGREALTDKGNRHQ